jgi:hypothetical protein
MRLLRCARNDNNGGAKPGFGIIYQEANLRLFTQN